MNNVVTNLGPNGEDGVSIFLGEADGGVFAYPDTTDHPEGGDYMLARAYGRLNGVPDQLLCTVRGRKILQAGGEGIYPVSVDFSPLGASNLYAQLFESKVRPIFAQVCYKCHSAEAERVRGGLLLDSRDGLLAGGDRRDPMAVRGQHHRHHPRDRGLVVHHQDAEALSDPGGLLALRRRRYRGGGARQADAHRGPLTRRRTDRDPARDLQEDGAAIRETRQRARLRRLAGLSSHARPHRSELSYVSSTETRKERLSCSM